MVNKKIAIFVIAVIILILGSTFVWAINLKTWDFTTEYAKEKYPRTNDYALYEDEDFGIKFLYPRDWQHDSKSGENEIIIKSPIEENESIKVVLTTKEEIGYNEEKFNNPVKMWDVNKEVIDGVDYRREVAYDTREIFGKNTKIYYNELYLKEDKENRLYNIQYSILLNDTDVMIVEVYSHSEDVIRTIAANLEY